MGEIANCSQVVVGVLAVEIQDENSRRRAVCKCEGERDDERVYESGQQRCEGLSEQQQIAIVTVGDLIEEVAEVEAEFEEVEVFYFLIFGVGLQFGLQEVTPVVFEGVPALQEFIGLESTLTLEQQLQVLDDFVALLLQFLEDLTQSLEILVFSAGKGMFQGLIHELEDNHLKLVFSVFTIQFDVGVVVFMVGLYESVEKIIQGFEVQVVVDEEFVRAVFWQVFLDKSFVRGFIVVGGNGIVQDDTCFAFAVQIEAQFTEIVFVFVVEVLVVVVVFVVVVVEAFRLSQSLLVISYSLQHYYDISWFIIYLMASKFKPGMEVVVNTREIPEKHGVVRFVGKIEGKTDDYVGIELDEPCGKNNGECEGKSYFKVEKKQEKGLNYGVFVRPASVKLATEVKEVKDIKEPKEVKKVPTISTRPGKAPQAPQPPTPTASQSKAKLANELFEQQSNQLQSVKEQLESAYQKIRQLQQLDTIKEVESLRGKLKEMQDINRTLRLDIEKVRYRSDSNEEEKLKELGERLTFFQNQKEAAEKQQSDLKKKIERLEAELEEGADRQELLEKLTLKIDGLQAKNEKLKADLQSANTQLKNTSMLGGNKGQGALEEDIATLNEMIALLQSDLKEEKEKSALLEAEIQNNANKLNELVKLERRVKSKEEENELLKSELQTYSDAASFVEKLTLDLIAKEEGLREQTKKLKQYAEQVNRMENEAVELQEMVTLQGQEMQTLQEEIQKHLKEKAQQQKHIGQLNDQIAKYKQRIRQLSDNNSSLLLNIEEKEDETALPRNYGTDAYQQKYYELSKLHQTTLTHYLQYQLQTATTQHYAGTYLANLVDTLPETFANQLHPHLLALLLKITAANHKLYLLFDSTASSLVHKSQLYTSEQQNTASWLLMLLEQIPLLYNLLLKVQMAVVSADTEEQIMEIISHPELKDQVTRIDSFTQELLQRVTTETIDVEIQLDAYIDPVEMLDKICLTIKKLPPELSTRLDICSDTMRAVQQVLSSIELYRRKSDARESAQVDSMLEAFLKMMLSYLKQSCTNPHLRLKSDMKSYLSGVDLVVKVLKEVELSDALQQLSSLYSQTECIKMLKDTVFTTQFHLKELINDLQLITYSSPLSKIHVRLPGKLWQDKLKQMRDELGRFQTTLAEKQQLQRLSLQQKRKIMILQKEIKDRQTTKEIHQRRIGELQLKVQQSSFLESDFKRQGDKLRSLEEAVKIIEEELSTQSRRKKELEDELKKTKERFDLMQTETMMRNKKQTTTALSTEDISNLAIFKSVVAQAGALRNHNAKRKLNQLAFSPIMHPRIPSTPQINTRRNVLNSLVEVKIGESLSSIQAELCRAEFKVGVVGGEDYSVGHLSLRSGSQAVLRVDVDRVGIASY